jgi:hypoxanthine phosphoribosyltransferase
MTDERSEYLDAELPVSERVAATEFAHPSERVAAQILDFYQIDWEYEPTTFPLDWDRHGVVLASFAPDFYLPEFDLFIELTTMSQKLVTKKNRKVRRLKELYPDVNIKILYQKDFRKLLYKFGIPVRSRDHAVGGGLDVAFMIGGPEGPSADDTNGGQDA